MKWQTSQVLSVLDTCCDHFTFPMLDNGYVYPAATRMSLYRSAEDWALVIEVFGFSPREGIPSTALYTFASTVVGRQPMETWADQSSYENHVAVHPHDESKYIHPVESGEWQDAETTELLAPKTHSVLVRGKRMQTPSTSEYREHGIVLEDPSQVHTFEFCRWLAAVAREDVLATAQERRLYVPSSLQQIMQLEEWNHPAWWMTSAGPATTRRWFKLQTFWSPVTFRSIGHPNRRTPTGDIGPMEAPFEHQFISRRATVRGMVCSSFAALQKACLRC